MPLRPPRPCAKPGCGALTRGRWCERHQREADLAERARKAAVDATRPSAAARGYGGKWREARLGYLARHPLCIDCQAQGLTVAATEVDHDPPHGGDRRKFWDRATWRARCKRHHSAKLSPSGRLFSNR